MSLALKPYPEYKNSGLPWLGEIPAHWQVERAKWLFEKMDRRIDPSHEVVTCFRDGVVTLRKNRRTEGFTESLQEIGYQGVRKGDLIIHAMDAFADAVGVSDSDGKCTPVYAVCKPKRDANPHYYARVVREMAKTHWITALAKGIRERSTDFRYEAFANQPLPMPPVDEQKRIELLLTRTDTVTHRLIYAKQQLIELLTEQKKSIIHQAVTRGLDPDVSMKPTGLDWLPEVPEHWEVKPLKQMAKVRLSGVDKHSIDGEQPILLCNYTDVYNNDFITGEIGFMRATASKVESDAFTLEAGDVLITKDSEAPDDIAVPALVRENLDGVLCGYHLALIRPNTTSIVGEYLFRALSEVSVSRQFHISATGVTRFGISKHHIKNALVPLPTLSEQMEICRQISKETKIINATVKRAQREIELIREYRTRLISDVVTGKLDVRGVDLPEPERTGPSPTSIGSRNRLPIQSSGGSRTFRESLTGYEGRRGRLADGRRKWTIPGREARPAGTAAGRRHPGLWRHSQVRNGWHEREPAAGNEPAASPQAQRVRWSEQRSRLRPRHTPASRRTALPCRSRGSRATRVRGPLTSYALRRVSEGIARYSRPVDVRGII